MNDDLVSPTADELTFPFCEPCGQWRIAGRSFCAAHPELPLGARRLSGRGTVYSFTVSHVAMSPDVKDQVPYTTVLVATDDGPRLLAHVLPGASPRIGDPVELVAADPTLYGQLPGHGVLLARFASTAGEAT